MVIFGASNPPKLAEQIWELPVNISFTKRFRILLLIRPFAQGVSLKTNDILLLFFIASCLNSLREFNESQPGLSYHFLLTLQGLQI